MSGLTAAGSSAMRLLHVTHQYPPALGGSERYFADLSEELARRGHTVDVATTRSRSIQSWRAELSAFERLNDVGVHRYRSLTRGRLGWHVLRLGNRLKASAIGFESLGEPLILFGNGPIAPGLAWHILRCGPRYDVVHIQTLPYAHAVYGYACARARRRPVVITPHIHVEQPETFDLGAFNKVLRGADAVMAVSEREIPYLLERGVKRERIVLGGNGVRLEHLPRIDPRIARTRLGLAQDAFVLLYLGRKEPYKGLPSVVEAFERLRARYPSLHLVSAGPPTTASRLLREEHAAAGWTDFDQVDDERKLDLLNACDVLLLPSAGEAFGIVFLEAWAVGKPVIGARAGAIPWVIKDGHDGLLVGLNDVEDLPRAIERLIASPQLRTALGANGHAKVRGQYTVARIADTVEAACRLALNNARH